MRRVLLPATLLLLTAFSSGAGAWERAEPFHSGEPENYLQELLSPEERQEYRQKLWALKTEAERERFRQTQRQLLEERARALVVLPGAGPYDEMKETAGEKGKQWPEDGLRRWPQTRAADDGLRRWRGKNTLGPEGKGGWRRWPEPEAEREGEEVRGW